jgi:hypothetical protein
MIGESDPETDINREGGMEIKGIIEDRKLSTEAKIILLAAEIEKQIRAAPAEEVPFHTYRAAFIPRVGELVRCRLSIGKGHFATLWHVKEVEHGVGLDRLYDVTLVVEAADTQTAMHWQRYPRESAE